MNRLLLHACVTQPVSPTIGKTERRRHSGYSSRQEIRVTWYPLYYAFGRVGEKREIEGAVGDLYSKRAQLATQ